MPAFCYERRQLVLTVLCSIALAVFTSYWFWNRQLLAPTASEQATGLCLCLMIGGLLWGFTLYELYQEFRSRQRIKNLPEQERERLIAIQEKIAQGAKGTLIYCASRHKHKAVLCIKDIPKTGVAVCTNEIRFYYNSARSLLEVNDVICPHEDGYKDRYFGDFLWAK